MSRSTSTSPDQPATGQGQGQRQKSTSTSASASASAINNKNNEEWWLPSFPRWTWTDAFTSGPRNDLIGILADKAVNAIHENLDPEGPIIQQLLDETLPSDPVSVRTQLPFYDSAVDALKYQRDNYLLGTKYANKKQLQRERQQLFPPALRFSVGSPRMPHDATALGLGLAYAQIVNLGTWFVPSETINSALLPIVLSLPSGALNDTITSTVSNAIPLAQPPLDVAMKDAVMGVINDPQIRQMIKSRTQKILRVDEDEDDNNSVDGKNDSSSSR